MIPKDFLITWISNMRTYVTALANIEGNGSIVLGCSCSGTGIWAKIFDLLLVFWDEEFGLSQQVYTSHSWACEIDPAKQAFLQQHHELNALFADVTTLCNSKVHCLLAESEVLIEWIRKYTSGFCCKDFSKQNKNRSKGRNLLATGEGESGKTYHGSRNVIWKFRPLVSTLENVPEAAQDAADMEVAGELPPEVCYQIKMDMEGADMTVVWAVDDAVTRGSLCTRRRIYPIIIDVHPEVSKKYNVEANFMKTWRAMKMPEPYPYSCFSLPASTLTKYCRSLKHSTDIGPLRKKTQTPRLPTQIPTKPSSVTTESLGPLLNDGKVFDPGSSSPLDAAKWTSQSPEICAHAQG